MSEHLGGGGVSALLFKQEEGGGVGRGRAQRPCALGGGPAGQALPRPGLAVRPGALTATSLYAFHTTLGFLWPLLISIFRAKRVAGEGTPTPRCKNRTVLLLPVFPSEVSLTSGFISKHSRYLLCCRLKRGCFPAFQRRSADGDGWLTC